MIADLRLALRLLVKSPGFSAVAIGTLALAIGANSAIFSLVNGLLLKPMAPERPEEVVNVFTARKDATRDYRQFSHAEYLALRETREVFSGVGALGFGLAGVGAEGGEMRRSFVVIASEEFFRVLGARPRAGRFFTAEESRPNARIPVAVLSHPFWQRLGGDPGIVGRTIRINDRPFTVIGIAPEGFSGVSAAFAPQLYLPLGCYADLAGAFADGDRRDLDSPTLHALNLVARLQPGLDLAAAKARLPVLEPRLQTIQPADVPGVRELQLTPPSRFSISTTPSDDGPFGLLGVLLLAMAGIVLLIACLNLANMLLARGTARAREMAVRLAVGATRGRIVRQLLIEGLVLALAGGALGVGLSHWANSLLEQSFSGVFSTFNISLASRLTPDATAIGATFLACLAATLGFSLGPALRSSRADLVNDLKAQSSDPAATGRWNRFFAGRHLLVMAQMTLSLVLLFAAGLFLRGALKAGGLETGFETAGTVVTEVDYSLINASSADAANRQQRLLEQVRALPGVRAAGFSTLIPYGSITNTARIMPANEPMPATTDPNAPRPGASGVFTAVTDGYLGALGVRLLQGRDFTAAEARDKASPRVCILDEGMARKLFPDGDALGQRVRYTQPPSDGSPAEMEVVGIVSRHRHEVTDSPGPRFRLYVPLAHSFNAGGYIITKLDTADPAVTAAFVGTLRAALRAADPGVPVLNVSTYADQMDRTITLWAIRLGAVLFGVFGSIALLLAVVGVYGVKAYAVERRTREIGIRMALGAGEREVFALIMRQGAQQIACAVAAGLILALLVGQALASVLFEVRPWDPVALAAATLLLTAATLLACFLPARRATRVSPLEALRAE
jgi:putative ABC transport system permease protein